MIPIPNLSITQWIGIAGLALVVVMAGTVRYERTVAAMYKAQASQARTERETAVEKNRTLALSIDALKEQYRAQGDALKLIAERDLRDQSGSRQLLAALRQQSKGTQSIIDSLDAQVATPQGITKEQVCENTERILRDLATWRLRSSSAPADKRSENAPRRGSAGSG
jgi:hypothetical protein